VGSRHLPLSTGTALTTSDRRLLYGLRQNVDLERGLLGVPAGYVNPDEDTANGRLNIVSSLKRELEEEVGTLDQDVDKVQCLGLVGKEQTYIAFATELVISFGDILQRHPREREFATIESADTDRDSLRTFIELNHKQMTKHSLANILLYGMWCYGEEWLD